MTDARQLPLQFDHRPALESDDFLVAPPNREAVAWIDRWPDWPGPALVVWGPAGSGKTHLAMAFLARTGGRPLAGDGLAAAAASMEGGSVVIDGVEDIVGDAAREQALFHLYNAAKESGGHLLITAATAPSRWPVGLPDLRSRLLAAPAVEIGEPDDTLLAALLVKQFADRQLKVDTEVVAYMLSRMERTFAAARDLVAAVDAESLAQRRNVTIPLVREVLARRERLSAAGEDKP